MVVHSTTWQWMSRFIDEVTEFTDSIKTPRIPMIIKSEFSGFTCEPLYSADTARFDSAAEYVTTCLMEALEGPQ
jgi:hypothetical protein